MEKSRLIGGIICLIVSAFLGALWLALPRDELMFMVGDSNIFLPPIILAVAGIVLVVTARRKAV